MDKVKLIELLLVVLSMTICARSQDAVTIGGINRDNPNHKRIFEWIENYKKKLGYQSYQITDQIEPSKQDLVLPMSYSSINDALRLASNQPQQQQHSSNDRALPNPRGLESLVPLSYKQSGAAPAPADRPIETITFAEPIVVQSSRQVTEPKQTAGQRLDPFIQDHIQKLQKQSLLDGRTVLVQVNGDDTSDKTLFDTLRPMLHDPTVLDQLRPTLKESKSLLGPGNVNVQYNALPKPLKDQPVLIEHKKSDLQYDRPILEQQDRLDKIRQSIFQTQQNNGAISQGVVQSGQYPQLSQPIPQPIALVPQSSPQQTNQQFSTVDQRALIERLEALAVKPLVNQYQNQAIHQTVAAQQTQPINYNQIPQNNNPEPILLGQRSRQTQSQSAPVQQPVQQPVFSSWLTLGTVDNQDKLTNRDRYEANANYGQQPQQQQQQPQHQQQRPQYTQQQQPPQHQQQRPQYTQQQPQQPQHQQQPQQPEDPNEKRLLREQLLRHLEEQEHKRQQLIEIDSQHRQLIADEIRKQEVRDQQEAERRAHLKQLQLEKQKKVGSPKLNRDISTAQSTNSRNVESQQWVPKEWPQNQNVLIKNQVLDNGRVGPKGQIDVLHSIEEQPLPQPQALQSPINYQPLPQQLPQHPAPQILVQNPPQRPQSNQNEWSENSNRNTDYLNRQQQQQPRQEARWTEHPNPNVNQARREQEVRWTEQRRPVINEAPPQQENRWLEQPRPVLNEAPPAQEPRWSEQPRLVLNEAPPPPPPQETRWVEPPRSVLTEAPPAQEQPRWIEQPRPILHEAPPAQDPRWSERQTPVLSQGPPAQENRWVEPPRPILTEPPPAQEQPRWIEQPRPILHEAPPAQDPRWSERQTPVLSQGPPAQENRWVEPPRPILTEPPPAQEQPRWIEQPRPVLQEAPPAQEQRWSEQPRHEAPPAQDNRWVEQPRPVVNEAPPAQELRWVEQPKPVLNEAPPAQDNRWVEQPRRIVNEPPPPQEQPRWIEQPRPVLQEAPPAQEPRWSEQPRPVQIEGPPAQEPRWSEQPRPVLNEPPPPPPQENRWSEPQNQNNEPNVRPVAQGYGLRNPESSSRPDTIRIQTQNPGRDWSAIDAALGQLQQREKQTQAQQTRRPIEVSATALAQAEQNDAEYVKVLREILTHQLPRQDTPRREPAYVPVEAPPTGPALTTTQSTGQDIDPNPANWWTGDIQRKRAERQ